MLHNSKRYINIFMTKKLPYLKEKGNLKFLYKIIQRQERKEHFFLK